MTETITPTPPAPDPAAAGGTDAGLPPAGFVSQTELEREQTRARTFQAELDRTKAELDRLRATPAPTPTPGDEAKGFDPEAFSQQLLGQVYQANALANAAVSLRSEFPHADPSIFAPAKLSQYGSVDALRIAAEADHNRVTSVNAGVLEAERAKIRAEFVAAYGQEPPTGPSGSGPTPLAGDPTAEQLAGMDFDEFARFDAENPGVADRVLRSVTPAGAMQHQIT